MNQEKLTKNETKLAFKAAGKYAFLSTIIYVVFVALVNFFIG